MTQRIETSTPRILGELEQLVMDYLWRAGEASAEQCREALAAARSLSDSTVRTVLRRLEQKGLVRHRRRGRAYIYRPTTPRQGWVARVVGHLIDRFCNGSVEQLLVGMVDNQLVRPSDLERLAQKIAEGKERP